MSRESIGLLKPVGIKVEINDVVSKITVVRGVPLVLQRLVDSQSLASVHDEQIADQIFGSFADVAPVLRMELECAWRVRE